MSSDNNECPQSAGKLFGVCLISFEGITGVSREHLNTRNAANMTQVLTCGGSPTIHITSLFMLLSQSSFSGKKYEIWNRECCNTLPVLLVPPHRALEPLRHTAATFSDVGIIWNTHWMATQTVTADAHKNETLHKTAEVLRVRVRGSCPCFDQRATEQLSCARCHLLWVEIPFSGFFFGVHSAKNRFSWRRPRGNLRYRSFFFFFQGHLIDTHRRLRIVGLPWRRTLNSLIHGRSLWGNIWVRHQGEPSFPPAAQKTARFQHCGAFKSL